MFISTTTNYVNGGLSVDLPIRPKGWLEALKEEGFERRPEARRNFHPQTMTGDYILWVMERGDEGREESRDFKGDPLFTYDRKVFEYAIVAYRDGSPDPRLNSESLLGDRFTPEEYEKVMETFFTRV